MRGTRDGRPSADPLTGVSVCRAGFAGRGTVVARARTPHARVCFPPRDLVSGRVWFAQGAGLRV